MIKVWPRGTLLLVKDVEWSGQRKWWPFDGAHDIDYVTLDWPKDHCFFGRPGPLVHRDQVLASAPAAGARQIECVYVYLDVDGIYGRARMPWRIRTSMGPFIPRWEGLQKAYNEVMNWFGHEVQGVPGKIRISRMEVVLDDGSTLAQIKPGDVSVDPRRG